MSEEEKLTKKQKIEDNRRLRAMSQSTSMLATNSYSPSILPDDRYLYMSYEQLNGESDEDSNDFKYCLEDDKQILLKKIEEHYTQAVRLNNSVIKGFDSPCLRNLTDHIECINEPAQISALRMITFFKLTPEFNVRFTLGFISSISIYFVQFVVIT